MAEQSTIETLNDLSPIQREYILRARGERKSRVWDVPVRTADAIVRKGYATASYRQIGALIATDLILTDLGRVALANLIKDKQTA